MQEATSVYELTMPSSHITTRMTAIVQSMFCLLLTGEQAVCHDERAGSPVKGGLATAKGV